MDDILIPEIRAIYNRLDLDEKPYLIRLLTSNIPVYDFNDARAKIENLRGIKNKMKLVKQESNFLQAKSFNSGDKIKIKFLNAGVQKEGKFGIVYEFQIESGGEILEYSLSGTNLNKIIDKYGEDSNALVGKEVELLVIPSDKATCGKTFVVI